MPTDRKTMDIFAAIEAAAQESRREMLVHVARASRLPDEELRRIENTAKRAAMMSRGEISALDARDELRAVSEMVMTLLTEVRRLRHLIAARNIEGETAALAAEESI